ncbi:MAG: hypothetical protein FJX62_18290 [Alphaproteobacteria bacterium]|nr:hypothetical protein [Alphaproteobacteria bacterium]
MIGSGRSVRWSRAVAAAALGVALVVGGAQFGAQANDDNEDDLPDVKILRDILKGFGLRPDGESGIEYRERAPLVLPPSGQLPAPQRNANTQPAAAWPKDPDVERARRAKSERRASNPDPDDASRPLAPGELTVPGAPRRGRQAVVRPGPTIEDTQRPSTIEELGAKSPFSSIGRPKEEYATFTREPARGSLTEPPVGYRTPSPNQPYGVGKQQWKPPSEADRHIPHR